MKKLRSGEIKQLAQCHTARNMQSWNSILGPYWSPELRFLRYIYYGGANSLGPYCNEIALDSYRVIYHHQLCPLR